LLVLLFPIDLGPDYPDGAYELREFGTTKLIRVTQDGIYARLNSHELLLKIHPRVPVFSVHGTFSNSNCLRCKPAKDNGDRPSASLYICSAFQSSREKKAHASREPAAWKLFRGMSMEVSALREVLHFALLRVKVFDLVALSVKGCDFQVASLRFEF
jgi:hypothetical protein